MFVYDMSIRIFMFIDLIYHYLQNIVGGKKYLKKFEIIQCTGINI